MFKEEHELLRVQQIIRPTGLLDPEVTVRPVDGQIDDLLSEYINRYLILNIFDILLFKPYSTLNLHREAFQKIS